MTAPATRRTEPTSAPVASCHDAPAGQVAPVGAPVVALVGSPNVGKSTLFNALTGARRTVGNWPGTTVNVGRGGWAQPGPAGRTAQTLDLLDLPGAYSLDPTSPDEQLTRDLLVDRPATERPELTVVVVDAAHLTRSLYLLAQLRETRARLVVALTMLDVAARRGLVVDPAVLSEQLGVPVVGLDPRSRSTQPALAAAVVAALDGPETPARTVELVDDDDLAAEDDRFTWVGGAANAATTRTGQTRASWSTRIDHYATSPVLGPLLFLAAMWAVFQVTTTLAVPLQNLLGSFVDGPVTSGVSAALDAIGLGGTPVAGFVLNGLVAGVGMLLTFVPLMALMFLLLALLEDSGYMARAAVVTDRLMRRLGLPGRAFLPFVVGFGCNVPAIAATRILPNARQRILTALLVPFTSCSARLTVYVLLAATFFPAHAGSVVFAMYVVSIALIVLTGLALRATLWRTMGSDPLVLDLPPYQRPTPRLIALVTWVRVKGFLRTASGIIVATVAVVWLMQSTPVNGTGSFGNVPAGDSLYGATAKTIAPVFEPAGFGEWRTSSGLLVGFVAKEAVISSWAQTYAVSEPTSSDTGDLGEQLRSDFDRSSGGHPLAAVLAFMIFLLAYTPCVATLAAQKREIGVRWTLFGVGLQLTVAWVFAVAVFQVGRLFL